MSHTANMETLKNLVIVGAGDLGREVLVWAEQAVAAGTPWRIKGFLDSRPQVLDLYDCGVPLLDSPERYRPDSDDVFLCAIGNPAAKREYAALMEAKGAVFATLIHPTALVGKRVEIGAGSIICPFTQLSCDIRIGRHVMVGTHSSVAHDTEVGDFSQISGGCQLNGHVNVAEDVFLGSSATLLPKCRVGESAYVGAGSVVLRRVKARTKVFGNPALAFGETQA